MLATGKISGRIRGQDNQVTQGYIVVAYLELDNNRANIGSAKTDTDGSFEISFSVPKEYRSHHELNVSIQVKDKDDTVIINTRSKANITDQVDFQIKLGKRPNISDEADIYKGGMSRLISAYSNLRESIDLSKNDVRKSLDSLIRVVSGWPNYRDELARACGLEVIQVPKYPRKEQHDHVSRWDEAVLPA